MGNPVLREESERSAQPIPNPPLPAETSTLARFGKIAPDLVLCPVSDMREALTEVPDGKVLHSTAQDRIDLLALRRNLHKPTFH